MAEGLTAAAWVRGDVGVLGSARRASGACAAGASAAGRGVGELKVEVVA